MRGLTDEPIILDRIQVEILRRRPPLSGTHVAYLGGDLIDIRYIAVDLDTSPPG